MQNVPLNVLQAQLTVATYQLSLRPAQKVAGDANFDKQTAQIQSQIDALNAEIAKA